MLDKIVIEGVWYDVLLRDRESQDNVRECGSVNHATCKIMLDSRQSEDALVRTLLHEIIEVIDRNHDLKLEHTKICTLETSLYQVLKDNDFINRRTHAKEYEGT